MKSMLWKNTRREIFASLGRYLSILGIIALGVGFFAGLRVTKFAMLETGNEFMEKYGMFDYRLLSGLGFTEEDAEYFSALDGVESAETAVFADLLCVREGDRSYVVKAHSLTDKINRLALEEGRMPQAADECVVDAWSYKSEVIGTKLVLSDENKAETLDMMAAREYTIVGRVYSPYYLNFERGSTAVGDGRVEAYAYMPREVFSGGTALELFVTLDRGGYVYSDEYNSALDEAEDMLTSALSERANARYDALRAEYESAKAEFDSTTAPIKAFLDCSEAELEALLAETQEPIAAAVLELYLQNYDSIQQMRAALADAEAALAEPPATYALDRRTNIGYASFENDTDIVNGISKVFPVFFILVAALVCSTTMSRMVDEHRTQIGVLRALGYSRGDIMMKYSFYSGSSAMLGCIVGYAGGSFLFPFVIWKVYDIMYGFADLIFVFNLPLAVISITVSALCSVGVTLLSCRREFSQMPAELIRPKSPKAGKRVIFEMLLPRLWKKMKFLHKVSVRNILRYKKRMLMMIVGIGGCTALLITGFGIRDSIMNIADEQFEKITVYDGTVSFVGALDSAAREDFLTALPDSVGGVLFASAVTVDVEGDKTLSANMIIPDGEIDGYFDLHTERGGEPLSFPGEGQTVISEKLARELGISVGERVTVRYDTVNTLSLEVTGIFENYVYDYIFIERSTCEKAWGFSPEVRSAFFNADGDPVAATAAVLSIDGVASATNNAETKQRFTSMLDSLKYIVYLVTACAAALALTVLYNLANINITERVREIATLKVLGFHPGETSQYVFRENIVLTGVGALFGIAGGIALHAYVMSQIKISVVRFDVHIAWSSFLISVALTFVFAFFVNLLLRSKLRRINMAESLKSVE